MFAFGQTSGDINNKFLKSSREYEVSVSEDFESGNLDAWTENIDGEWEVSTDKPLNGTYSLKHKKTDSKEDAIALNFNNLDLSQKDKIWRFRILYSNSNPSGSNKWSIALSDQNVNTTLGGNFNGYVIGVNYVGSDDFLKLWKVEDGTKTAIIETNYKWDNTINPAKQKGFEISRSKEGTWEIKVDKNGGFDELISLGSADDNSITECQYMCILYKYSKTYVSKLTLDDIYLGDEIPDLEAPTISNLTAISPSKIKITLSEDIKTETAQNVDNFTLTSDNSHPKTAELQADNKTIILTFENEFTQDTQYTLKVKDIEDLAGNKLVEAEYNFKWITMQLSNVSFISDRELMLNFTSNPDNATATTLANYVIEENSTNPSEASISSETPNFVKLTFTEAFAEETEYSLKLSNITDEFGNIMPDTTVKIMYYVPKQHDIVINEIMCDINPLPQALPPHKYIEIYNRSNFNINLKDWTLQIGTNSKINFTEASIPSKEYLIICSPESEENFKGYGITVPILKESQITTTGKSITIADNKNTIIETVKYSNEWYGNSEDAQGGKSLERIDFNNFCGTTDNWTATKNITGGTPGTENSVHADNPDNSSPKVINLNVISSQEIALTFSEKPDSSAFKVINYTLNSDTNPTKATLDSKNSSMVHLEFDENFKANENTLKVENISDPCGNTMQPYETTFMYKFIHVKNVQAVSKTHLKVKFSEKVDAETAQNINNYLVDNSIGNPKKAQVSNNDLATVFLTFEKEFEIAKAYNIEISNIKDANDNIINDIELIFYYYIPKEFDVVFTEIMCDVNPKPQGLPEKKYVELFNTSDFDIDITGWGFQAEGGSAKIIPAKILKSGEYVILTQTDANFEGIEALKILSSSDLSSTSKKISLFDANKKLIQTITYTKDWYGNPEKSDGGWSMEIIDPHNFCQPETNWKACENPAGGTPGKVNSVNGINPDNSMPEVIALNVISSKEITLTFSEKPDSSAVKVVNYTLNSNINPAKISIDSKDITVVHLNFAENFKANENTLKVENIKDPCGNTMQPYETTFMYEFIHVTNVQVVAKTQLKLNFSENVDAETAQNVNNYLVDNSIGNPKSIQISNNDLTTVFLTFEKEFETAKTYNIEVSNIKDVNNNIIKKIKLPFYYYVPKAFDVVFTEIMCDVNPKPQGLPAKKYVELFNTSDFDIDITGWSFQAEGGGAKTIPSKILKSGEYIVLSEKNAEFENIEALQILSSSDLSSSSKKLSLFDASKNLIQTITYTKSWYGNSQKSNGGWSMEIIDPYNFCEPTTNWKACENPAGGTPGKVNSVNAINPDSEAPVWESMQLLSSNTIELIFSEKLNKEIALTKQNYQLSGEVNPQSVILQEGQKTILLKFQEQFKDQKKYTLSLKNISDNCGNSIEAQSKDFKYERIHVTGLFTENAKHLILNLSEVPEKESALNTANYAINLSPQINPNFIFFQEQDSLQLHILFENDLPENQEVTFSVKNIKDKNNNTMPNWDTTFIYRITTPLEIVINEVLFNPYPNGADFVEIYNRSNHKINLKNLFITRREKDGSIKTKYPLSTEQKYIEPGQYLAYTVNKEATMASYYCPNTDNIIQIPKMPSLPSDQASVLIINNYNTVIDEFTYSDDMHFPLLSTEKGVSLERISFKRPSQDVNNWHSASETAGFATPGYENSQLANVNPDAQDTEVVLEPETFSPDQDGYQDFLNINYAFDEGGYTATIIIFDSNGRQMRVLKNNVLLSTSGTIKWDGLHEDGSKMRSGIYVIYFKAFKPDGSVKEFKKVTTLSVKY